MHTVGLRTTLTRIPYVPVLLRPALCQGKTPTRDSKEEMRQRLHFCHFHCQARLWGWFWSVFGIIPGSSAWSLLFQALEQLCKHLIPYFKPHSVKQGRRFPVFWVNLVQYREDPRSLLSVWVKIFYADISMPLSCPTNIFLPKKQTFELNGCCCNWA